MNPDDDDYYESKRRRHEETFDLFIDTAIALVCGWVVLHFFGWL